MVFAGAVAVQRPAKPTGSWRRMGVCVRVRVYVSGVAVATCRRAVKMLDVVQQIRVGILESGGLGLGRCCGACVSSWPARMSERARGRVRSRLTASAGGYHSLPLGCSAATEQRTTPPAARQPLRTALLRQCPCHVQPGGHASASNSPPQDALGSDTSRALAQGRKVHPRPHTEDAAGWTQMRIATLLGAEGKMLPGLGRSRGGASATSVSASASASASACPSPSGQPRRTAAALERHSPVRRRVDPVWMRDREFCPSPAVLGPTSSEAGSAHGQGVSTSRAQNSGRPVAPVGLFNESEISDDTDGDAPQMDGVSPGWMDPLGRRSARLIVGGPTAARQPAKRVRGEGTLACLEGRIPRWELVRIDTARRRQWRRGRQIEGKRAIRACQALWRGVCAILVPCAQPSRLASRMARGRPAPVRACGDEKERERTKDARSH
ncbi:uncharacterized protein FIBRA_08447 [Fibroporia radiculosa]|uniref:Uncharacterized protein n=1 Tax=Fibroporia radiculosa TaxID=599839 RepID=J4H566_9APHY|nr:uncharacterized protein FIBRA_08447 [Fibroporia radiculosa]CCM06204.1 predicted protein [Fibroporia radiculosa]